MLVISYFLTQSWLHGCIYPVKIKLMVCALFCMYSMTQSF